MTDREARLDELEAAFAQVPVPPVSTAAELAEAERDRASRHFGFTPEDHHMSDNRTHCYCCDGTGWHESECGGRHFCQACGGTGGVAHASPEGSRP